MMSAGLVETFADKLLHVDDIFELIATVAKLGGLQHLLDRLE